MGSAADTDSGAVCVWLVSTCGRGGGLVTLLAGPAGMLVAVVVTWAAGTPTGSFR